MEATAVTGNVAVDTSFGEISVKRVGGDARLVSRHGEIEAEDITGAVYAESRYDDVTLARIAGPVEVRVTHGGVEARTLGKGAVIRASGEDVVIDGFKGGIDVQAERGGVRLSPWARSTPPSTCARPRRHRARGARGQQFTLDAGSSGGEVQANLAGFTTTETGPARVKGTMNGGGVAVILSADARRRASCATSAVITSENAKRKAEGED